VVVDGEGRPICTEMMPGNTADVSVLVPVIDRLRHRFGITRAWGSHAPASWRTAA
jgi:transposase